jgi:hypothetical protein
METRTIYLRDDWKGVTPAEVSVFVHEWCTTFRFQGITDMAGAVAGLVPVANDPKETCLDSIAWLSRACPACTSPKACHRSCASK